MLLSSEPRLFFLAGRGRSRTCTPGKLLFWRYQLCRTSGNAAASEIEQHEVGLHRVKKPADGVVCRGDVCEETRWLELDQLSRPLVQLILNFETNMGRAYGETPPLTQPESRE
jgi:hypothetical protein